MYKFICENNHLSHSAAKEQKNPGCPTCGAPSQLVTDESQDKATKPVDA